MCPGLFLQNKSHLDICAGLAMPWSSTQMYRVSFAHSCNAFHSSLQAWDLTMLRAWPHQETISSGYSRTLALRKYLLRLAAKILRRKELGVPVLDGLFMRFFCCSRSIIFIVRSCSFKKVIHSNSHQTLKRKDCPREFAFLCPLFLALCDD